MTSRREFLGTSAAALAAFGAPAGPVYAQAAKKTLVYAKQEDIGQLNPNFVNGEPLTSGDVKYTFENILSQKSPGPIKSIAPFCKNLKSGRHWTVSNGWFMSPMLPILYTRHDRDRFGWWKSSQPACPQVR